MKVLTNTEDVPEKASRPFDAARDGFVAAEGAALLILEDLEHALARGVGIYAELTGYGHTSDAFHVTAPNPDGVDAAEAMRRAMREADIGAKDISYINAHGTGTQLNDKSETLAIKQALGEDAYHIPISSTKSMTGHILGATAAAEAIFSVKALQDNFIPPTINLETPDPDCDLDYTPNRWRGAAAGARAQQFIWLRRAQHRGRDQPLTTEPSARASIELQTPESLQRQRPPAPESPHRCGLGSDAARNKRPAQSQALGLAPPPRRRIRSKR